MALFYSLITIAIVGRFLFATVYGALLIAFVLYLASPSWFGVEPLDLDELVMWFAGLASDYKVALLASLVTIAGFAIAFHTATINWRNQLKAELKKQTAGEIEHFFAVVGRNITTLELFAEELVEVVNQIQNGTSLQDASFRVGFIQGRLEEYVGARNTISQASVDVHRLISRNHNILASGWGLLANARVAAAAVSDVSTAMWIRLPIVDVNDPNHVQVFLNLVNVTECNALIAACDRSSAKIAGISGGIHGYLLAPVVGFTFPMYWHLLRHRKEFLESLRDFYQAK